jgi:hypothetical protein
MLDNVNLPELQRAQSMRQIIEAMEEMARRLESAQQETPEQQAQRQQQELEQQQRQTHAEFLRHMLFSAYEEPTATKNPAREMSPLQAARLARGNAHREIQRLEAEQEKARLRGGK